MRELNHYMNKAFDYEERGHVEGAIQLCSKCVQAFPEYKNEIKLEMAKIYYRNKKKEEALKQFLELLRETKDIVIHDLILEGYYGVSQQEFEERYQENYRQLKVYPHFFGCREPEEIRYYPIWKSEDSLCYYDSVEKAFYDLERCRLSMKDPKDCICLGNDLLWIEDILLLEKLTRTKEKFMDCENPLLAVYRKETWELLLQLLDLKELMVYDRIIFYDDRSKLEMSLLEEGVHFPSIIVGELSDEIFQILDHAYEKYQQEYAQYKKEALEYYHNNGENILKHMKEGTPKILFLTSRFTTVLQYHVRDCKMAAERMGLSTELIIEKDSLCTGWTELLRVKKITEFKPDVIFLVDHFKFEDDELNDLENIICISWVQDPMENVMDKKTPGKLGSRDFVMNHYISSKEFNNVGYSESCLIDAPVPANSFLYKPYQLEEKEREGYSCDICFVCHGSAVETCINRVFNNIPVLHDEIYAVYKGYQKYVYETGNIFYTKEAFKMYIEQALLHHYNIELVPNVLEYLTNDMQMWFNQVVFRQALVDWIIDAGFTNIKLWGNGWLAEEKYKKYAMGPAKNGETLSKIYQASKIVVGNNIMTTSAARAWESMLSGAFYLSNYIPEENDYVDIRKIIEVGKDVIMFYNREDLIEKLHYYLEHEDERQEMIKRGREAALEKMTYDVLMKRVLKEVAERLEENTNG